jgi:GDP-4-dehydro-6-deoxy-D-mannose reductase
VRILVTGAAGFVGRWLVPELEGAGHEVLREPPGTRVDVSVASEVFDWLGRTRPDAVIHLAAVSRPTAVEADPRHAFAVAVAGTANVVQAFAAARRERSGRRVLLVAGSGEVYGRPNAEDLPLRESDAVRPATAYALTKLAQEGIALSLGRRSGLEVIATRSFNHTGPGQPTAFAVAAFADRILAAQRSGRSSIPVGNIDIRRDLTDVRDVVGAYRRLVEVGRDEGVEAGGLVVNVASGRSVPLRGIVEELARLAGADVVPVPDPSLVRAQDALEVRADITRITALTGWRPTIELQATLRDVLAATAPGSSAPPREGPARAG